MATTLTRYLKLKIAEDLSADARYNLTEIDKLGATLGATFTSTESETLEIKSKGDIQLTPQDASIGGSGSNGDLFLGDTNNYIDTVDVYSAFFRLRSSLRLRNSTLNQPETFLSITPASEDADVQLTLSLDGSNRSIVVGYDGTLVTENATQVLTNKTISGDNNPLSNIPYSALLLSGTIVNSDISTSAAIATSKLSGPLTAVASNGLGTLSEQNTASLTTDVTGILPIANGGTGNDGSDRSTALISLLPIGEEEKVLRYYNGQLEWYLASGTGTVQEVALSMPGEFSVSGSPINSLGTFTVTKISQAPNTVYSAPDAVSGQPTFRSLIEADIPTLSQSKVTNLVSDLSGKEPTITGSGNASQFWNGNKSFTAVTKSDVGLSNVDNTSDADKPISTATATALSGKEPTITGGTTSQYWRGDKTWSSPVVNSTAGSETDQAASVAAMKSYVASAGGAMSFTWAAGTPASPIGGIYYKTITHNLNSLYLTVTVLDNSEEVIWVDSIIPADVNSIVLGSSQQPPSDWTVIVRPAPAP